MKKIKVLSMVVLTVLAFVVIMPTIVQAATNRQTWGMTENELRNSNLSPGTIYWDDDLVYGDIEVVDEWYNNGWYNKNYRNCSNNKQYSVYLYEDFKITDKSDRDLSKKQIAKKQAQIAFVPVRANAQNKGWWDCDWRFVTVKKNKVAAEATVEYKSVTMNRNSKSVYIRQITKKKNGRWETMFFVGDRSYTPNQISSIFN
ncbi:hypothetical protein IJ798_03365 [Candidatus Saccharibacteria bacterium]|nr:hypothetical protein [Candidatus Saccharibacteria bacterium]